MTTWKEVIGEEFRKPYFKKLEEFITEERSKCPVYPPHEDVLAALKATPFESVKAVIVGQDPYHGAGQAHGLSFSVKDGVPIPPSLLNIFREIENDLGFPRPKSGNLQKWAESGVLMLNTVLTVRGGSPGSHAGKGWEEFTDAVLRSLYERPSVFVLWGKHAQKKGFLTNPEKHRIVASPHPSPMSKGFLGSKPFSRTNKMLEDIGMEPIDWSL